MTVCAYCQNWAATTRKQLKNRLANMDYNQGND